MFRRDLVWQMGNKARQIVIVDLVGERMLRRDEDIGQETRLSWRDVCKPAAIGLVSVAPAVL